MRSACALIVGCLVLSGCATPASIADVDATIDAADQKTMSSRAFLDAHPDMKYRTEGWFAYEEGRFEDALAHFELAASYGDKLSQAMLAEMYWNGQGTAADRARGYAWADLAAERGYVQFLPLRERYWQELVGQERERAIEQGRAMLAEYGDATARPRLAEHLRRQWRHMISYRPRRDAEIVVPGENGAIRIRGSDFYDRKFWEPERYEAWVDKRWAPLPKGQVEVQELEVVQDPERTSPSSSGQPGS